MTSDEVNPGAPGRAGRTAIITGGSGGIGRACAKTLLGRGYDVVLTARREGPLAAAADELGCRYVVGDCAEPEDFARVVGACEGGVHLLVHSAGLLKGTFVRKEALADFDELVRANLRSTFVAVKGVLPAMGIGGRIIVISSSASTAPMRGRAAYSASKAGVNAFADALRDEVFRDGIHVNVVVPAPVETDMLDSVTFEMYALQASDVADAVGFLDDLHPRVVLPQLELRAVDTGPLAPPPVVPAAAADVSRRAAQS